MRGISVQCQDFSAGCSPVGGELTSKSSGTLRREGCATTVTWVRFFKAKSNPLRAIVKSVGSFSQRPSQIILTSEAIPSSTKPSDTLSFQNVDNTLDKLVDARTRLGSNMFAKPGLFIE